VIILRRTHGYSAHHFASESDHGDYISAIEGIVNSSKKFSRFRRNRHYRLVLEHTTYDQGKQYLDYLLGCGTNPSDIREIVQMGDIIGTPYRFDYSGFGLLSPSSLRYMAIGRYIRDRFGADLGHRICEIGVGYGGQLLVLDQLCSFSVCDLYDLPPVLKLSERYLESHQMRNSYSLRLLNQTILDYSYDFVLSSYAFSELPRVTQILYVRKILSTAKRGLLIMNSGIGSSVFGGDKLSIDELRELLPEFETLPELIETYRGNYMIAWG